MSTHRLKELPYGVPPEATEALFQALMSMPQDALASAFVSACINWVEAQAKVDGFTDDDERKRHAFGQISAQIPMMLMQAWMESQNDDDPIDAATPDERQAAEAAARAALSKFNLH